MPLFYDQDDPLPSSRSLIDPCGCPDPADLCERCEGSGLVDCSDCAGTGLIAWEDADNTPAED